MKRTWIAALAVMAAASGGCDGPAQLDTRTYSLRHLRPLEASEIVAPYVYSDREGAPGEMSGTEGALTVRETLDNLDKIARVLQEFDRPRSDVRLHFQLIEADGFEASDSRIAAVEEELRRVLQFQGYRLAGEGFVSTTDGSEVIQALQGSDDLYEVRANVYWVGPTAIRLDEVRLLARDSGMGLTTTVNIQPGQTLVLGSSPKGQGSTATLLLTVRAEEAASPER